jgi:hypothetical protein
VLPKLEYLYFYIPGDYGDLEMFDMILELCPTPAESHSFKAVIFHWYVDYYGPPIREVERWLEDMRWDSKGVIVSSYDELPTRVRDKLLVHHELYGFDWAADRTERDESKGKTLWEKVDDHLEERHKLAANDKAD